LYNKKYCDKLALVVAYLYKQKNIGGAIDMDIRIKANEGHYKCRVCGAVIKDDKLLVVEINHDGFNCLPGGHVQLGESSHDALLREIGEEVGITCTNTKLVALIENFFDKPDRKMHELCFCYVAETNDEMNMDDYEFIENDNGELKSLQFRWIKLDDLPNVDFRPKVFGDKLAKRDFEFEHIIFDQRNK